MRPPVGVALQARHVLHVVADDMDGAAIGSDQTECATVRLQMLAKQAHAGVDDLPRIGHVLQCVFQHQ